MPRLFRFHLPRSRLADPSGEQDAANHADQLGRRRKAGVVPACDAWWIFARDRREEN